MAEEIGRDIVGGGDVDAHAFTLDAARVHRDLALGNLFVTARAVLGVAGKLLQHILDEESR